MESKLARELESKIPPEKMYYAQSHQLDPLGAAVANSVVKTFEEEKIIEKSQEKIKSINQFLKSLSYPFIKETRTHGMIFGIQIESQNNQTTKELIIGLKNALLNSGILLGINLRKNLLRLVPPLNITENEIEFFGQRCIEVFNTF